MLQQKNKNLIWYFKEWPSKMDWSGIKACYFCNSQETIKQLLWLRVLHSMRRLLGCMQAKS
jgi:hypothetical protein